MEVIDTPNPEQPHMDELINFGYKFRFSDYISRGMDLFKEQIGLFVAYTFIYMLVLTVASYTVIGSILLTGPMTVGFYIVANRLHHGQSVEFSNFFDGFKQFVPLLIAQLIMGIFIVIGFFLLVIPGIYLAVAYSFVNMIIVFAGQDFWEAMENSRKIVSKQWFNFLAFHIVLGLINFLGALALGVGMLFTFPITMCAAYAAYQDILGTKPS